MDMSIQEIAAALARASRLSQSQGERAGVARAAGAMADAFGIQSYARAQFLGACESDARRADIARIQGAAPYRSASSTGCDDQHTAAPDA